MIHRVIEVKPPMGAEDFELYAQKLVARLFFLSTGTAAPLSNGARTDCGLHLE